MRRIRLRLENMQQVKGGDGIAVILLTDMQRMNAITVVCDEQMMQQILMRMQNPRICATMLPEALFSLLPSKYEMMVFGLYQGQYQVVLMDEKGESARLRMSDAVLLMLISDIPLYIEEKLMQRQCTPYDETAPGIAIPINTTSRGCTPACGLVKPSAFQQRHFISRPRPCSLFAAARQSATRCPSGGGSLRQPCKGSRRYSS